jgi:D-alanyl-D-alanine carboxypeptidase
MRLKKDMMKEGIQLNIISTFRSVEHQKNIFEKKYFKFCEGKDIKVCKRQILKILRVSSPPGYSKHHTGMAVDFSCGNSFALTQAFSQSICYKWLAKNNFQKAKEYNFYPSYPFGVSRKGPLPEPWEFT